MNFPRLFVAPVVLLCALPAAASAAPATPEFLAQWEKADRLYAGWDLLAAADAIEPLLMQANTLDGHQRVWFDYSAVRTLAAVGRHAEAAPFFADSRAVVGEPQLCPEQLNEPLRGCHSTGYVTWQHPDPDAPCVFDVRPEFVPRTYRKSERQEEAFVPASLQRSMLPRVPGGSGVVESFFGGQRPLAGRAGGLTSRVWCDVLFTRRSGAPTGPISGTSKHTVVVPTRERIVTKRRVAPGARIEVQAFETNGKKLIATWKPRRGKALRQQYAVRGNRVRIRAPRARGVYDLQLGIGKPRNFATGISGVGVGRPGLGVSDGDG